MNHEFLIAKFRVILKKAGKTTRSFKYDLNQIPYDHTVEVRNRFKGLDLIDRVPDEIWMEVSDIVQERGINTFLMEKKCKRAILHRNLGCQVHESRQIGSGQTTDGKGEHRHSRNQ